MKVGDRYKSLMSDVIIEMVNVNDTMRPIVVCIQPSSLPPMSTIWDTEGKIHQFLQFAPYAWEYMGNYSKSNNFKLIYDILNEED